MLSLKYKYAMLYSCRDNLRQLFTVQACSEMKEHNAGTFAFGFSEWITGVN
jgi:hypothetical protein